MKQSYSAGVRRKQRSKKKKKKNCFPLTAFKNLSSPSEKDGERIDGIRLQPLQPRQNPVRFSLSVKPTARRRQSGDHLPPGGAPPSPPNPLLPTRAYGCCDARTCYCVLKESLRTAWELMTTVGGGATVVFRGFIRGLFDTTKAVLPAKKGGWGGG